MRRDDHERADPSPPEQDRRVGPLDRHELGTAPRTGPLIAALGTLAVSNVVTNQLLPDWAYVPWNCGVAALLVGIAMGLDGADTDELGLAARRLPDGIRWGAGVSTGLLAVYLVGLALPWTHDLFIDDRADVSGAAVALKVLVTVPLGTVLLEEVAFRGVLPAMFRRRLFRGNSAARADVAAALLFGVWHVLPAWNVNEVNPVFRDLLPGPLGRLAAVSAGVVGTAAAGMSLSWLRNRSGSLAAPAMLHCTTNSLGYFIAWLIQRG